MSTCTVIHSVISHVGVIENKTLNLQTALFGCEIPDPDLHVMFMIRLLPRVQVVV